MIDHPDLSELAAFYLYDSAVPLALEVLSSSQRNGSTVQEITYNGADDQPVPAYLVISSAETPVAAVIWGHWMMPGSPFMNKTEFLDEAIALANSGVVSLMIDSPLVRPGIVDDAESYPTAFRRDVIDLRRGIDLLQTRPGIHSHPIAYVGHSFHAATGAILACLETRIAGSVLMAGALDANRLLTTNAPRIVEERKSMPEDALKQFIDRTPWMNPASFLGIAQHTPIFLQYADNDEFVTLEDAQAYAGLVSPPKHVQFYAGGHELNASARHDRIAWLQQVLSLSTINWQAIDGVPALS